MDFGKFSRTHYKNKYHAKSCHCHAGHYHHSKFEAGYCDQLHLLKKNGDILDILTQKKFSFDINGVHITNYYADFVVVDKDGITSVHETKGFKTQDYIIKRQLFKALYSEIPFHEIQ